MPISVVLKLEIDEDAKLNLIKLKDSLWLNESNSFERLRIYLHVEEGGISGLRLIVPSNSAKFSRDVSHVVKKDNEEKFMRSDIKGHIPVKVGGAFSPYDDNHTEIVLRFMETLEKGKYLLMVDLETESFKKSDILTFLLQGVYWTHESQNYDYQIKDEDFKFIIGCERIETWIIPPLYKRSWKIEPDGSVVRYALMTEKAISTLEKDYLIPNPGPPERVAYQWEHEANFGYNGAPSMISRIHCRFAVSPLILSIALLSLTFTFLAIFF